MNDIQKRDFGHPDSIGKCNTATFGKNLSGRSKTQTLHRRRINLVYNCIYSFLCCQAPIVFLGKISPQYPVAVFYAPFFPTVIGFTTI
jgi:hypothetical protein